MENSEENATKVDDDISYNAILYKDVTDSKDIPESAQFTYKLLKANIESWRTKNDVTKLPFILVNFRSKIVIGCGYVDLNETFDANEVYSYCFHMFAFIS